MTRPPPPAPAYTEAHSALNGPLLARYLLAPAAAETAFLLAGLAAGIRLDQAAVSIGAVGSARAASPKADLRYGGSTRAFYGQASVLGQAGLR